MHEPGKVSRKNSSWLLEDENSKKLPQKCCAHESIIRALNLKKPQKVHFSKVFWSCDHKNYYRKTYFTLQNNWLGEATDNVKGQQMILQKDFNLSRELRKHRQLYDLYTN